MSLFNETADVKIKSQTQEAYTINKVVNKKITMKLVTGDTIVITVNGNDVINATIPANKQVLVNMDAQIKDI